MASLLTEQGARLADKTMTRPHHMIAACLRGIGAGGVRDAMTSLLIPVDESRGRVLKGRLHEPSSMLGIPIATP